MLRPQTRLLDELVRLNIKECLLADSRGGLFEAESQQLIKQITQRTQAVITERPE